MPLALLHHVHHPRQVEQRHAGRSHLLVQQAAHGEGIERYAGGQLAAALGVPAERRVAFPGSGFRQQRDAPLRRFGRKLPEYPAYHPVPAPVGTSAQPVRHQSRRAHAAELALPLHHQRLQPVARGGQRGSDARRAAATDHQVVALGDRYLSRLIGDGRLGRLHELAGSVPDGVSGQHPPITKSVFVEWTAAAANGLPRGEEV